MTDLDRAIAHFQSQALMFDLLGCPATAAAIREELRRLAKIKYEGGES